MKKILKKNENIASIHTDKTGKIVILDKNKYINVVEEMFCKMKLEIMNKDPNNILQDKVVNIINEGKWPDNKIPVILYHAPNTTRAFGKFKKHKDPL